MVDAYLTAPKDLNLKVPVLFDDAELKFRFLTDFTGRGYPDRKGEEACQVSRIT